MIFKNFRINVAIRVFILSATIFLGFYFVYAHGANSVIATFGLLTILQIILLVRYVDKMNYKIIFFLESIKYDDFSITYPVENTNASFKALHEEFNKVLQKFRELRSHKEADFHYFRTIIQHIGTGIITCKFNGDVQLINVAAKKFLKINQLLKLQDLEKLDQKLFETISNLSNGQRSLVKISRNGEIIQLSVQVIVLILQGEKLKLISLQNIQSELEEKEMEAWQTLIKILTHEIMNSVTPISSLSGIVASELSDKKEQSPIQISTEEIEDLYLAVNTIEKRSVGLVNFVNDFRNLASVPKPKIALYDLEDLFNRVWYLMKPEIESNYIHFSKSISPPGLSITADGNLVEQVLINILQNAIHALDGRQAKEISLTASVDDLSRVCIEVKDNGRGISEEVLEKIFIPFFTTKKTGSGIGLSLSKQIMRLHKGSITVQSKEEEGTVIRLTF